MKLYIIKKKNKAKIRGAKMNKKQAKEKIQELRKQVEYHAKKYYDDDKPEISDFEYDMLMVELRDLEKEFPELV